jgi:hypothetical protein
MQGQMRILFGENLANEGIGHFLDTLSKIHQPVDGILLAMTPGNSKRFAGISISKH